MYLMIYEKMFITNNNDSSKVSKKIISVFRCIHIYVPFKIKENITFKIFGQQSITIKI